MKPLILSCLLAVCAWAEHGVQGGGRSGGGAVRSSSGGHIHGVVRTLGNGRHHNSGYGYGYGYGGWDYDGGNYQTPEPAQPVVPVVSPSFAPPQPDPPVHPVIHEYGPREESAHAQESGPVLYLIAFRDKTIRAAMIYWLEGGTLHYMDRDHKLQQAPIASVDRDLSAQLNRERDVPFNMQ